MMRRDASATDELRTYHWTADPCWVDELGRYTATQDAGAGTITLDIAAIESVIFNGDVRRIG